MTPLNLQPVPHSSLYKHSSKLHLAHSRQQQHSVFFNKMAKLASALCFILAALTLLSIFVPGCRSTSSFVGRRGAQFVLDGSPFLFNGFNAYWMMHVAAEPAQRGKVSVVLREAAAAGLTVGRTWAFNDGGGDRALQVSPGVYDERVFQGLDFVISEAKKNGVRLILSLANNFEDFGGRAQYVKWARDAGVAVNGEDDFYTNPVVKGYYKNHVKRVLTRINSITKISYKDDPTILAWELINEPRCQADSSGKTVHTWALEMASYTKSLDKKHMLEIGMEGFYGDSTPEKKQYNPDYQVGTDYISSNLIDHIDFATIHAYPDLWLPGQNDGSQTNFLRRWMRSHWDDAVKILKKPLVLAEFGLSKKNAGIGYSENLRNAYFNTVHTSIYNLARTGGGSLGGGLVWQLMAEGMESYYDGYEIVLSRDASTKAVLMRQSHAMSELAHTVIREGAAAGGARDEEEEIDAASHVPVVDGRKHEHRRRLRERHARRRSHS
ncbi:mannan endo-1,4-beta-mannosidase 5-like [Canna indica]|uniref:mannan endo-1,4-beta-mannosidase n=1 Tax=Canna indica TaxID=4628 RepID=A0AAQ3KTQ9_9LILI|nr:mannan endo-1,4-beta-mannosidase 5-like [Canna indica]